MIAPAFAAPALCAANLAAFLAFGIDKACARHGWRRISEPTLLALALLGGTAGAYAGRAAFRHKTRKQPFCASLHAIAALQALLLAVGSGWWLAA